MENLLNSIKKGAQVVAIALGATTVAFSQDYQANNSFLFKDNGDLMMKRGTSESVWKRAMVSYAQPEGSELVLNFGNDYPAGTRISSKLTVSDELFLKAVEPLLHIDCNDSDVDGAKIRMTENGSKRGAFLHYNSLNNVLNIGVSNESGGQYSDVNAVSISRSNGDVAVNTPFTLNSNESGGHARLNLSRSNTTRIAAVSFGEGSNHKWHTGLLYNYGAQSANFYICQEDYVKNASTTPNYRDPEFTISTHGNVGIGVLSPGAKLDVDGSIRGKSMVIDGKIECEEVEVKMIDAPDYVFAADYNLMSLKETKAYIESNQHLPNIPAAKELAKGVGLVEMNHKLLEKVEELTLHQIALLEQMEKLQTRLSELESE